MISKDIIYLTNFIIFFILWGVISHVNNKQLQEYRDEISKLTISKIESQRQNKILQEKYEKSLKSLVKWSDKYSVPQEDHLLQKIVKESMEYENGLLILSIIKEESNFNIRAKSEKNALGLTQVHPETWMKELKENGIITKKSDLYNHKKNIRACNYILGKYYQKYNNWDNVVFRYVGGDWGYVERVKNNYFKLLEIAYES